MSHFNTLAARAVNRNVVRIKQLLRIRACNVQGELRASVGMATSRH